MEKEANDNEASAISGEDIDKFKMIDDFMGNQFMVSMAVDFVDRDDGKKAKRYACGSPDHRKRDCPQVKKSQVLRSSMLHLIQETRLCLLWIETY